MGFIGKSDREERASTTPPPSGTTFIAAQSHFDGSLTLTDNLHIDGRVEGTIDSKADVAIGESGHFDGTITAKNIVVSGQMSANVDCQRLEIVATGQVKGEVITDDLVIESGGRFIGKSCIREDKTVSLIKPDDKSKDSNKAKDAS